MKDTPGRYGLNIKQKDALFGISITAPAIILLALLFVYPIIYSFLISFTNYNYVKGTKSFIGFENYINAFSDVDFINSLKVTLVISFSCIIVQFIMGIMLSVFVMHIQKGQNLFKSVFLIPMMIAPTVAGLLWKFMLNNEFGIINVYLGKLGIDSVPWLIESKLVVISVIIVDSWTCIPFVFLLLYTALSSLPQDMMEAAKIDGSNSWQMLWRIQLPYIRDPLMVALVLRFMDVFRIYDSIYIMTRGGPGTATEALSLYIYRVNWQKYQMGKASAMSYIMMVIMLVIGLMFQYYSDDKYTRKEKRILRRGDARK